MKVKGICKTCSEPFSTKTGSYTHNTGVMPMYCSRKCAGIGRSAKAGKPPAITKGEPPRFCPDCGVRLAPNAYRCPPCREVSETARRTKDKVNERMRKRLLKGEQYEAIDVIKVFEAWNWTCAYCNIPTPKELKGLNVEQSPELDHIMPLSKGGTHTYSNVVCSCMRCNRRKGAQEGWDLLIGAGVVK